MLLQHAELQAPSARAYFQKWAMEALELGIAMVALVSTYYLIQVVEEIASLQ